MLDRPSDISSSPIVQKLFHTSIIYTTINKIYKNTFVVYDGCCHNHVVTLFSLLGAVWLGELPTD